MSGAAPTLLVIDDSKTSRELLCAQLDKQGYQTVGVGCGQEALQLLQQQAFDLVLLDIEMPGTNGLEVLVTLRQTYSLTELPIIMVSGRDQTGDMVASLQLGANDYIVKPYNFPVVLARVKTHLSVKGHADGRGTPPPGSGTFLAPLTASRSGPQAAVGVGKETNPTVKDGSTGSVRGQGTGGSSQRETQTAASSAGSRSSGGSGPISIPGYEIQDELGRGGMGVVYKARHQRMDRIVALKVINQDYLAHASSVKRFYQEVRAAAQLSHPNIVVAYDAGESDSIHHLSMEYVDGIDLSRLVKTSGPLAIPVACEFIRQAAAGLQHACDKGMVHRDVKPSNLLVALPGGSRAFRSSTLATQKGTIKILDMGLALLASPGEPRDGGVTREGHWVGTPDYISPEQATDPHHVDIRADLYSLGCTFYYLLAGCPPFPDIPALEKLLKHNFDDPVPIEKRRADVPPEVAAVIRRLMAKRPEQRPSSPKEVAESLP